MDKILEAKNLSVKYFAGDNEVPVLRGVNLTLNRGECIGIVGESGCGKSTFASALLSLIDNTEGRITSDHVKFYSATNKEEIDLSRLSKEELRDIRGNKISMILQDPYSSLNPVIRIGRQLKEAYLTHNPETDEIDNIINEKLKEVHLPSSGSITKAFPHQLSGGMLQRVSIAAALLNNPEILIADEPTSSLDVTIQKKIIENLKSLRQELNLSLIFISHNLNLVSGFADRIYILYAGKFVEYGPTEKVFSNPAHPYTKGLISALPHISKIGKKIVSIPGNVPSPGNLPEGCSFSPRCDMGKDECNESEFELEEVESGHFVRCVWM